MNRKKYKIQQLAEILGTSEAAIRKKISQDPTEPLIKRYKKRYDVVIETLDCRNTMMILLSESELQEEIRLARVNKMRHGNDNNVLEDVGETFNEQFVDVEYNREPAGVGINTNDMFNRLIEFTEHNNKRYETLLERTLDAESKLLLLEDKTGREGLYLQEIKDIKAEKKKQARNFTVVVTLIVCLLIVTLGILIFKLANPTIIEKQTVIEKRIPVNIPVKPTQKKVKKR